MLHSRKEGLSFDSAQDDVLSITRHTERRRSAIIRIFKTLASYKAGYKEDTEMSVVSRVILGTFCLTIRWIFPHKFIFVAFC